MDDIWFCAGCDLVFKGLPGFYEKYASGREFNLCPACKKLFFRGQLKPTQHYWRRQIGRKPGARDPKPIDLKKLGCIEKAAAQD